MSTPSAVRSNNIFCSNCKKRGFRFSEMHQTHVGTWLCPTCDAIDGVRGSTASAHGPYWQGVLSELEVVGAPERPRAEATPSPVADDAPPGPDEEAVRQLKALDTKAARSVYLEIAARDPQLTGAEFKALAVLTSWANPTLANAYPLLQRVAERLGTTRQRAANVVQQLKHKGYVRTQEFQTKDHTKQASSGFQFCLPARMVPANGGKDWEGPAKWKRNDGAQPRRRA